MRYALLSDPRACFALVDIDETSSRVQFARVAYDIENTVMAILDSGLPNEFADVIRTGGRATSTASAPSGGGKQTPPARKP